MPVSELVRLISILFMLLLVSCGGNNSSEATPTATTAPPTTTPLPNIQSTPLPTSEVTPTSMTDLTLWWPEPLNPLDRPEVTQLIGEQIEAFDRDEESLIDIEFRLKRYQDVGGIMATLRTASSVAPGALPDLTLMRREDLLTAVQSGLIYPLEGLVPSSTLGDLYGSALSLGQVDGQIYGLPYLLDIRLLAYHPEEETDPVTDWSFDGVLDRNLPWVFTGRRTSGLNATFYAQYIDAGGTVADASGNLTLNEDALRQVLVFYDQAVEADLLSEQVFEYASINDYLDDLISRRIPAAVIDSTAYLRMLDQNRYLAAAPIPTLTGNAISTLNGWLWVITTNDRDQQEVAARFLNWMMDSNRQRDYAQTIYMLPSQRSALVSMDNEQIDLNLMDTIVSSAILPLPDNVGGVLPRAMQTALTSVVSGQSTVTEAVAVVRSQVGE